MRSSALGVGLVASQLWRLSCGVGGCRLAPQLGLRPGYLRVVGPVNGAGDRVAGARLPCGGFRCVIGAACARRRAQREKAQDATGLLPHKHSPSAYVAKVPATARLFHLMSGAAGRGRRRRKHPPHPQPQFNRAGRSAASHAPAPADSATAPPRASNTSANFRASDDLSVLRSDGAPERDTRRQPSGRRRVPRSHCQPEHPDHTSVPTARAPGRGRICGRCGRHRPGCR